MRPMSRSFHWLLVVVLGLAAAPAAARRLELPVWSATAGDSAPACYRGDRVVVRLRPPAARAARALARRAASPFSSPELASAGVALGRLGAHFEPAFRGAVVGNAPADDRLAAWWSVDLRPGADLGASLDSLAAIPEVELAEPVPVCPVTAIPDDSLYALQWNLGPATRHNLQAPEAWDVLTDASAVPVAILDTGILRDHPDLGGSVAGGWGNLWTNEAERLGRPGVDDDGNGYVDDVWGWDFVALTDSTMATANEDWRDQDNDPSDFTSHGTAVASVVGAIGNNRIGTTGVLWKAKLMALRVGWSSPRYPLGEVDMLCVAQALDYARRNGAKVVNASFANFWTLPLVEAALAASDAGVTIVVAAGNYRSSNYLEWMNDVISVSATDSSDVVAAFSNRSAYIDIAAPGVDLPVAILSHADSTGERHPSYVMGGSGTSFSAPQVAAAVAMLQARRLGRGLGLLSPADVQRILKSTSDDISALNPDGYYGAGRLNLHNLFMSPNLRIGIPLGAGTVGSPVVLRTYLGRGRIVVVTDDQRLLLLDPVRDTITATAWLPARAVGGAVAASLGGGRGNGLFVPLGDGSVFACDAQLRALAGWPVAGVAVSPGLPADAALALGDLDGDGRVEVVEAGGGGEVRAWRLDGTPLAGFPYRIGGWPRDLSLALDDLDGAPGLEIVVATATGQVLALDHTGAVLPGWPQSVTPPVSPPVVVRDRATGAPRIVVAAGTEVRTFDAAGRMLRLRILSDVVTGPPAVGDLDGDGADDLVIPIRGGLAALPIDPSVAAESLWVAALAGVPLGPVLVGPVHVDGSSAVVCPMVETDGSVRFDLIEARGASLPFEPARRQSPWATLADLGSDGATDVVIGAGADGSLAQLKLTMAPWQESAATWRTARGNAAHTGSRSPAPALDLIDDALPYRIQDLRLVAQGPDSVVLGWTAKSDAGQSGIASYSLRYARGAREAFSFALAQPAYHVPPPGAPGTFQQAVVVGLDENAPYVFAIASVDSSGNMSAPSNLVDLTTLGVPPAPVSDLRVASVDDTSITITWTAVGDDGRTGRPALYEVRAAHAPLTEADFTLAERGWDVPASVDAGEWETLRVAPWTPGPGWWLALRAVDDSQNRGAISNVVPVPLSNAPARVLDLRATSVGDTSVTLRWTPAWEGAAGGRVPSYEVRAARDSIVDSTFDAAPRAWTVAAGTTQVAAEVHTIVPFVPGERCWIALRGVGATGIRAPVSDAIPVALSGVPPDPVRDLRVVEVHDSVVVLRWSAAHDDAESGHAAWYELRAAGAPITPASFRSAPLAWTLPGRAAAGAAEIASVAGIPLGQRWWFALRALDLAGGASPLSNVVDTRVGPLAGRTDIALLAVSNPARPPVSLFWSDPFWAPTPRLMSIHDVQGRLIRTLEVDRGPEGVVRWDGRDEAGMAVPPGLYLVRFAGSIRVLVTRLVILR